MRKELRRQDITFETKDQPLRDDVRILGTLVGDLLRDQGGDDLFELVENARQRSIRRRENNEKPGEELAELVKNLDLDLAMEVIRAFSTYFQMVNTAEKVHRIINQMVDPTKAFAATNGPGNRCAFNLEDLFNLIQQIYRIPALAIELVDEGHNRSSAHSTHFHQLDRTFLYTLGRIYHHQRRIDGRQGTIRIFREISMARGIKQIDHRALIGKLHNGRSDRYTTLLFQLHPVGGGMALCLATFNRTGKLNRATVQQELFS